MNTVIERMINKNVDLFELQDKLIQRYTSKFNTLTSTIDYKDTILCSNLLQKDQTLIIEWTKSLAKEGMLPVDKLGVQLIFCGQSDSIDSKLNDIKAMVQKEQVIMTKDEFLNTKFEFESILENGIEEGYVAFERAYKLKQLIVDSIFGKQDNIDLV